MAPRSLRNIETRKKKKRNRMSGTTSRVQGNTAGVRRQLKKAANITRGKVIA